MPTNKTEYSDTPACNVYQEVIREYILMILNRADDCKFEVEVRVPRYGYVRGIVFDLHGTGENATFGVEDGAGARHSYEVAGIEDVKLTAKRVVFTYTGIQRTSRVYEYADQHPTIWRYR
jgi:hypothetical protein